MGVSYYASQVRFDSRMRAPHNFPELSPQVDRPRPEGREA